MGVALSLSSSPRQSQNRRTRCTRSCGKPARGRWSLFQGPGSASSTSPRATSSRSISSICCVTLHDLISWWFMPVNIGIFFLTGGTLGWIVVKILRPGRHLEGLVIGSCSAANLGNLVLILVPAICNEAASPFGDAAACRTHGLSYVSMSMALGNVYIWTYTYRLMRKSGALYDKMRKEEKAQEISEVTMKIEGNGNCNDMRALKEQVTTHATISEEQTSTRAYTSNTGRLEICDLFYGRTH